MTDRNDMDFGSPSVDEPDKLSSTAMLQRRSDSGSPAALRPTPAAGVSVSSESVQAPGEFTQRYIKGDSGSELGSPVAPTSLHSAAPLGEFTQRYIQGQNSTLERPLEQAAVPHSSVSRLSPSTSFSKSTRLKGFSTPGATDSASNSSRQLTREKPAESYASRPIQSGVTAESAIHRLPTNGYRPDGMGDIAAFRASVEPGSVSSLKSTDMLAARTSLSADRSARSTPTPDPAANTIPSYPFAAIRPSEPSVRLTESTTKLIERLSQIAVVDEALAHEKTAAASYPPIVEPGPIAPAMEQDHARLSKASEIAASAVAPVLPKPVTVPLPVASSVAVPMPPAAGVPALAAIAAPKKSALESLAPILLVVNTFLLLLILLVVIFGLKK